MSPHALNWHTSSYSNASGGECVEVLEHADGAEVRDTRHRDLGRLAFSSSAWAGFLTSVKRGEL
ncbi:uncharacterized protein DUF397 [Murinocardiopsis flavida]|uniref:Uncharacterized protein DUF397 n=1 Tax=Murinocardiopsis flavida TaxID=645275 RepID=A0A2P8D3I1_9ACTN|nr:DUF397 domain-containing protein [Murinocardiopsis flavida]PSK91773.1 uncharacterized protein DUF397 [Murinocardiopsis flavida]